MPKWNPQGTQMGPQASPNCKKDTQTRATPKRHYDTKTYPRGALKTRLHPVASNFKEKTSLGRVLAEGDVELNRGIGKEREREIERYIESNTCSSTHNVSCVHIHMYMQKDGTVPYSWPGVTIVVHLLHILSSQWTWCEWSRWEPIGGGQDQSAPGGGRPIQRIACTA